MRTAIIVALAALGLAAVGARAATGAEKIKPTADGVALIDQSTILAAGGFPYHVTEPGSYRLIGPVTAPALTPNGFNLGRLEAILIEADDVSLDLNGFTVRGGGVDQNTAPAGTPAIRGGSNIRAAAVRNGVVVSEEGRGITLAGIGSVVEGIRYHGQNFIGPISVGPRALVRGNTIGDGGTNVVCGPSSTVVENAPNNHEGC
jgi:hypothetical protein